MRAFFLSILEREKESTCTGGEGQRERICKLTPLLSTEPNVGLDSMTRIMT